MPAGEWRTQRCSRNAIEDDYCRQHHPEAVAKREAERQRKFNAKINARLAPQRRASKYRRILGQMETLANNALAEGRKVRPVAILKLLEGLDDG